MFNAIKNWSAGMIARKVYKILCLDYLHPTNYTVEGRTPANIQRLTNSYYPALIEILTKMVHYDLLEENRNIDGYITYKAKNIPEIIKNADSKFLFSRYCNVYIDGFNFYYN